ncbi:transglutaminase domain-containing protein [Micromonospora tulbaghiae]|uniref:transglutaminase domain-containing protein n=1 Tax=Micromonospora tulbaghiae TaxID=479978 RepID=UPI0034093501
MRMADTQRDGAVARLVGRLRRIPDEAREFVLSAQDAWREFRMPPGDLRAVTEAGLPVHVSTGDVRYDRSDLINLSLHLGVGPWAHTMRTFLPRALDRVTPDQRTPLTVRFRSSCPTPRHPGPCRYGVLTPYGTVNCAAPRGQGLDTAVIRFRPAADAPDQPVLRELAATVEDLDFVWLPEAVREDLDFVRSTGLGDCIAVSQLLVAEGRRRGLAVRPCYGLLVMPPQSIVHFWAEVQVDGTWIALDPVLLRAMVDWGALDPRRWHPGRTLGALTCRLAAGYAPLTTHADVPVPFSLPTSVLRSWRSHG